MVDWDNLLSEDEFIRELRREEAISNADYYEVFKDIATFFRKLFRR